MDSKPEPKGWIPLWRCSLRSRLWREGKPSDWKLWSWILFEARTAPNDSTPVGCVDISTRQLAKEVGMKRDTVLASLGRLEHRFRSIRTARPWGAYGPTRIEIPGFRRYRSRSALADAAAEPEQLEIELPEKGTTKGARKGDHDPARFGDHAGARKGDHGEPHIARKGDQMWSPDRATTLPEKGTDPKVVERVRKGGEAARAHAHAREGSTGGRPRAERLWDLLIELRAELRLPERFPAPGDVSRAHRLLTGDEPWTEEQVAAALRGLALDARRDPVQAKWLDGVATWEPEVLCRGLAAAATPEPESTPAQPQQPQDRYKLRPRRKPNAGGAR